MPIISWALAKDREADKSAARGARAARFIEFLNHKGAKVDIAIN
jgi:hypothetical protein